MGATLGQCSVQTVTLTRATRSDFDNLIDEAPVVPHEPVDGLPLRFQAQTAPALASRAHPEKCNRSSFRQMSLNVRHGSLYAKRNTNAIQRNTYYVVLQRNTSSAHADKYIMESDRRPNQFYQRLCIEAHRATEELKNALGRRGTSKLKSRLLSCGSATEWKNVKRCGAVACATCRARYTSRQVAAVQEAFEGAGNDNLAFVSIILGLTSWTGDIGDIFIQGRRKLRNIIDKNRRVSEKWQGLSIVGWMEVDAFDPHRFADLPPDKKVQLEAIGLPWIGAGPTWVVTIHALVNLAGVDRYRLAEELRRGWKAPTQVDVRQFDESKNPDTNINSLVRYCLKHRTATATTVCYAEPWDMSWRTEYYEYLDSWSPGFKSLRVWIKPRASKEAAISLGSSSAKAVSIYHDWDDDDHSEENYMPFTF